MSDAADEGQQTLDGLAPPGNLGHDIHRVDPAEHRGRDVGILDRRFELPADRRDADHRGPRPLPDDRRLSERR